MPKYLGIDFLSQALRQIDQLLCRMLICCPGNRDDTVFEISGKNERNFSWYLAKAQKEKVPTKDAESYLFEILPSRFGRKPERWHSTARSKEYVPSSNPDSPPPSFLSDSYFDFEEEIIRDVCDYLCRHEVDVSKIVLPYSSNTEECMQLEEIVMRDCFQEFLRRVPRFQDLTSRLKPRKVADPFVGQDGCLRSESKIIRSKFCCDNDVPRISIVEIPSNESFVKLPISKQTETENYKFASPLVGSAHTGLNDVHDEVNCDILSPDQSVEVILKPDDYFKEIQNFCKTVTWTKHQKYDTSLNYNVQPVVKSFLEINQTDISNAMKDVSPLVLESPPPNSRTEDNKDHSNKQDTDHLEPCHLEVEVPICVLSPRSQKKITQEIVASSRLPDKISSLILVVPDIVDKETASQDLTYASKLSKEDFQSDLELKLHWDPLYKTREKKINQLRYNIRQCSALESPMKVPNVTSELKPKLKKVPWKNVYVTSTNASPLAFELAKQIKPSPLVSLVPQKENKSQTHTLNSTRSESSGKTMIGNSSSTTVSVRTSKMFDDSKKYNIHSGIDDFVLLRTGVKSSSSYPPSKAIVKAMNISQTNASKTDNTITKILKVQDMNDYTEIVDTPLEGELQTACNYIENHIRPYLVQLQEAGCVASSYNVSNLTEDYTRFVLKQEEKRKWDTNQYCDDKKYKMLICLHVLVTTAELIKECGITVAQDYFKIMCAQYNNDLDGALDRIKDNLTKIEQSLNNTKTSHPKIVATDNYVRKWQPQPSPLSLNNKILVVIFRGFHDVSTSIISQLQQHKGLKVTAIERRTQTFPLISNAHVVICDPANIPDNFPWSSFASFIAYEDKIEYMSKVLFGKSVKVNNFICFKGASSEDQQKLETHKIESFSASDSKNPNQEVYALIGSSRITKNATLLRCLEQTCGIVIIEREYEILSKNAATTSSKMCRQPDLMLDQNSSVIIENVVNFSNEEGYKNIVDLVLSTSFKCQVCSIILVCEKNSNSKCSFAGEVQSNLSKFHGCLMSIKQSFPHFVVDTFYSRSVKHTASLIRRLCEITRDSSRLFTRQDWIRRNWLAEECSEDERFLLGFPSLNSFSAQLMLNVLPLTTLLTASFESLKKALPWIPESILKNFKETTECGLYVEENGSYSTQMPQFLNNDTDETTEYHFNPVIENTEEDLYNEDFTRPGIPSTHFLSSQQLDDGISIPFTSSFSGLLQKETRANLPHNEPNKYCGNFKTFSETHPDDSYNYENLYQRKKRQVRSPVRSTFDDVIQDIANKNRHPVAIGEHREKSKLLFRPAKNLKRGYEMPDVVGVVQPKPRNIPIPELRRKTAISATTGFQNHKETILPTCQYSKSTRTDILYHSMYEKPQKKKKLTYEIVPGSKNGQTKLAFV